MKKLLVLVAVLAFVGAVQAANFDVANAGFENGVYTQTMGWGGDPTYQVPTGWATWTAGNKDSMSIVAGNGSANALRMDVLPGNTNGGYCQIWNLTASAIPLGTTSITLYMDIIDLTPGGAKLLDGVTPANFAGAKLDGGLGAESKFIGVTGSWATYSKTWTVPATTTSAVVAFAVSTDQVTPKGDTPCAYAFDNIRLVPEPMTMVLLGLGGLFLRRRSK
jgi:hypothetical protein